MKFLVWYKNNPAVLGIGVRGQIAIGIVRVIRHVAGRIGDLSLARFQVPRRSEFQWGLGSEIMACGSINVNRFDNCQCVCRAG